MMRAVIIGAGGQDGQLLWQQLAEGGFALVGVTRNGTKTHFTGWKSSINIGRPNEVRDLVGEFAPDHIYYLAAYHHSSQDSACNDNDIWQTSWNTHVEGFRNFLEAAKDVRPQARIFYASSSRVFGNPLTNPQNESTPMKPVCVYGVTKAAGMMLANYYRERHQVRVSCGILFNHESPLRAHGFLSQRVARGLAEVKRGLRSHLEVGDLEARVDWGYAPDYTNAMRLALESEHSGDFVVATGKVHSVREMIEIAADYLGLDWTHVVTENRSILQRSPLALRGDSAKLRQATGWSPTIDFGQLVRLMAQAALASLEKNEG